MSYTPTSATKPLGGRYQICRTLGSGSFGQTFLAIDLQLPGQPQCVVKQLKSAVQTDQALKTARRLFATEATVLAQLGEHPQIPRLLAHFEENEEFYLVQELVEGQELAAELLSRVTTGQRWSEKEAIAFLQDLLSTLAFVHTHQVIHRDIKPSNLIRRTQDQQIVLIDFGAVKQVRSPLLPTQPDALHPDAAQPRYTQAMERTIAIGTDGYMPLEQVSGRPRFSSDVYAVGMIAIQGLTGQRPTELPYSPDTGEVEWHQQSPQVSAELRALLDSMVCCNFRDRYQSAAEALSELKALSLGSSNSVEPAFVEPAAVESNPVKTNPVEPASSQSTAVESIHEPANGSTVGTLPSEALDAALPPEPESNGEKDSKAMKAVLGLVIAGMSALGVVVGQNLPVLVDLFRGESVINENGTTENVPKGSDITEENTVPETVVEPPILEQADAIASVERLYSHLSAKQWNQSAQLFSSEITEKFRPGFFENFERVTVENLQVISQTDDVIELVGENTFVYPDGSFQVEERAYTLQLVESEPLIVETALLQVLQRR